MQGAGTKEKNARMRLDWLNWKKGWVSKEDRSKAREWMPSKCSGTEERFDRGEVELLCFSMSFFERAVWKREWTLSIRGCCKPSRSPNAMLSSFSRTGLEKQFQTGHRKGCLQWSWFKASTVLTTKLLIQPRNFFDNECWPQKTVFQAGVNAQISHWDEIARFVQSASQFLIFHFTLLEERQRRRSFSFKERFLLKKELESNSSLIRII